VIPSGVGARVRGLESHGTIFEHATAGERCAINLGGLAVDDLARGETLVHPEQVLGSHILDVELRYLATAEHPLPKRSKVLFHHGTAQVLATLNLLGEPIAPGTTTLAQIRIDRETPLAALPGDHFLVRGFHSSPHHGATIGGGTIVRVLAPKAKRSHAEVVAAIAAARLDQRIVLDVRASSTTGLTAAALTQRTGIADLAPILADLVATGELVADGERYLHPTVVVHHERATPAPTPLTPLEQQVLAKLEATGIEPPRPKELAGAMGLTDAAVKPALDRLLAAKLVIKIKPDLVMHARIVDEVRAKLLAFLATHPTIDAQQWKELTGASRKYTIPLAEFFDAEKLTLRIGDVRRKR
jgi:DNA-binding MarR family transcriptional regulator